MSNTLTDFQTAAAALASETAETPESKLATASAQLNAARQLVERVSQTNDANQYPARLLKTLSNLIQGIEQAEPLSSGLYSPSPALLIENAQRLLDLAIDLPGPFDKELLAWLYTTLGALLERQPIILECASIGDDIDRHILVHTTYDSLNKELVRYIQQNHSPDKDNQPIDPQTWFEDHPDIDYFQDTVSL